MKNFSLAITMLFCFVAFGQEKTVTGIVSEAGGALPGANVVVKGTTRSTQTDFDGKFTIKANPGEVLVFSFTSYDNLQITVGSSNSYNVKLKQSEIQLQEEVPYYRPIPRQKITAAQSTVKVEDIKKPKKLSKREMRKQRRAARKIKDTISN